MSALLASDRQSFLNVVDGVLSGQNNPRVAAASKYGRMAPHPSATLQVLDASADKTLDASHAAAAVDASTSRFEMFAVG